jgi:hypothetical protein
MCKYAPKIVLEKLDGTASIANYCESSRSIISASSRGLESIYVFQFPQWNEHVNWTERFSAPSESQLIQTIYWQHWRIWFPNRPHSHLMRCHRPTNLRKFPTIQPLALRKWRNSSKLLFFSILYCSPSSLGLSLPRGLNNKVQHRSALWTTWRGRYKQFYQT